MTNSLTDTTKYLELGIEAARNGNKQAARKYLSAVLRADPNSVSALFWLAFVAPSPQASTQLLERVLQLEPDNDRARAGLAWANKQIEASGQPPPADAEPPPVVDRRELLSNPAVQMQAQNGAAAHRARRTINPFLGILLLVGLALIVAGGWALAFVPPDTLAAWLPVSTEEAATESGPRPGEAVIDPVAPSANGAADGAIETEPSSFTSLGDTVRIPVQMSQMPQETLTVPDVPSFFEPEPDAPPVSVSAIALPELVGPDKDVMGGPILFAPVDEDLLPYQPAAPDEKWIEVDVTKQRVTAWEGNVPVMTFLSSTGLPNTPTVLGQYNIYWKLESTLMTGPGYYLPDVPYTMYFYGGYALHGAYWHDNFGQPMSHGCVNLCNENAKALFEWAGPVVPPGQTQVTATFDNPGTLVVVHQ
jgi:hypothetical protein